MTNKYINSINEYTNKVFSLRFVKVMSWGISKRASEVFEGNPALSLKVSGRLFKGYVKVIYMPDDTYTIAYVNIRGNEKLERDTMIYIDQLIDVIDSKIEKIPSYKY